MRFLVLILAVSFTGSSVLPGASSIRTPSLANSGGTTLNVQQYGAKGDGITDNSKAFLAAWNAACSSTQPSTINIPNGKYVVGPVSFTGPCKNAGITVQVIGDLIAPTDNSVWKGDSNLYWLEFTNVDGLTISGGGSLDGNGASWWNNVCSKNQQCKPGPATLRLAGNKNVVLRGFRSINSRQFHISLDSCDNVLAEGLTIQAPGDSPNTDGIHVASSNVHIRNVHIGTGDDCIGILEGTSNLLVEQVTCGPGHGISVGSLGKYPSANGVTNVTVDGAQLSGTQNGVRIKTWPGGKGFAKGLTFKNIVMSNVRNPIIIDQYYCPHCSGQESVTNVQLSNVVYQNISGTSATEEAINLACSKSVPCEGVQLQAVNLNYAIANSGAQAVCKNAKGISVNSVSPPVSC